CNFLAKLVHSLLSQLSPSACSSITQGAFLPLRLGRPGKYLAFSSTLSAVRTVSCLGAGSLPSTNGASFLAWVLASWPGNPVAETAKRNAAATPSMRKSLGPFRMEPTSVDVRTNQT